MVIAAPFAVLFDILFYFSLALTYRAYCIPCGLEQGCNPCPTGFETMWPIAFLALLPIFGLVYFFLWLVLKLIKRQM